MQIVLRSLMLLCLLLLFARDGVQGQEKKVTSEQIQKAIDQLGDKRFTVREKATKILFEAGSLAEKQLELAAKSPDPDVANRAKTILDNFAWGIYPGSDPKVKEFIESYKKGDTTTRIESFDQLLQLKPIPFKSLKKIIAQEASAELRQQQTARLAGFAQSSIPDLIRVDRLDEAEETFDLLLSNSGDLASDYAALLVLRKRVELGIAKFEKICEGKDEVARFARLVLVYLYRTKRDWANVEKYAKLYAVPEIEEGVYLETGNWKELLKQAPKELKFEDLGYRLALARLAGDQAVQTEIVKEILDPKEKVEAELDIERNRLRAIALIVNLQANEGIKLLFDSRSDLDMVFDFLVAQTKFDEALALVDQAMKLEMDENRKLGLQLHRARLLYMLGDKDSAVQLFRKYGPKLEDVDGNSMIYSLIRTEARLGLKDLACEQLATFLASADGRRRGESPEGLFEYIFPSRGMLAYSIWLNLREARPKEEPGRTVTRVKQLLEGKGKEDLEVLAKLAEKKPETPANDDRPSDRLLGIKIRGDHQHRTLTLNLAELYAIHGQDEGARKFFLKAIEMGLGSAHVLFADYLFDQQKFLEAAEHYAKETTLETGTNLGKTLGLALQGRCFQLMGKKQEGDLLIERAFWMPLGNESLRSRLIDEFKKRDWPEAAKREAEMLLRSGELGTSQSFPALHYLASASIRDKDFARATDCYQRLALGVLRLNIPFTENSGYLAVPEAMEVARGQQLLKDGKVAEAVAVAKACQKVMPGNIDTVLAFVPELDRLKKTTEADSIYQSVRQVYEKILKDHPKSAYSCNSLAWMMASCRRDLDDALKYATKAVEFEPANHGYLDTLAEAHFRRGEKDKAIELMKKCIAMEPTRRYYRKQLNRFEKLAIDSDPAEDHED